MNLPVFVEEYWKCSSAGELLVGGFGVSALVSKYGTPLFIYDRGVVETKYALLRLTLPNRFSISYSVKANPNPAFLRCFVEKGCGLEVASAGEFQQAQNAGCSPTDICFAGPGKTEAEIEEVIAQGIGEIHAESELEIERISSVSHRLGVRTAVAVRVNPTEDSQGGAMRMGGKQAPFGVDEEALDPLLYRITQDRHLDFSGIHLFVGTQILDHHVLLAQYRKGIEIAVHAAEQTGLPVRMLDFGGGLGIPYFATDEALDMTRLGEGLKGLVAEIDGKPCFENTRFVVEPGRFLVGDSGVYVTRITDIKSSRGKKYLILDGGMHHHLAASGNLGQVVKRNFPIAVVNRLSAGQVETVDVVGPLCTPLDTLGRSVQLPKAQVGDCVGIFQSGAYARTASPLGFLSHPSPPEVWVEDGRDYLIRRRGNSEDVMRDVVDRTWQTA
jgi:diaminopimelate decarboxylase